MKFYLVLATRPATQHEIYSELRSESGSGLQEKKHGVRRAAIKNQIPRAIKLRSE